MTVDEDLAVLLEMLERHDYCSRALLLSAALLHVLIEKNGRDIPACLDDFNAFAKRCVTRSGTLNPKAGAKDPKFPAATGKADGPFFRYES